MHRFWRQDLKKAKKAVTEAVPLEVICGLNQAALLLQGTRRQILAHLSEPESAAGLARKLGLPRQRLNYHLRELEREGLVECTEERRKGNCVERLMRATARSFIISPEALSTLGDTPETARDRFSASYLVGAVAKTIRDVASLQARARGEGKRLATLTIEADIRFANPEARSAFGEELANTVAALVAKYHDEHAQDGRSFRMMTAIHPALADVEQGAPVQAAGGDHDKQEPR